MPVMGSTDMERNKMPKPIFEFSTGLKDCDATYWEKFLGNQEEKLRSVIANVPKKLKRLCLDFWFPSECMMRAIQFVKDNPKLPTAEYIYGESIFGGLSGQHGWVEFEDLVFEPVLSEWYEKEGYYTLGYAKPWYRYSRPATMYIDRKINQIIKANKTGKFDYLWHLRLKMPWGNNTPISLEQAEDYFAKSIGPRLPNPIVR
jgi:hypothetical protein